MAKHLHKDIGEQFRDEINLLSQQPREHIWENIDKQLDKTDAKNFKDKFTRLKKRTLLLLLLLIGISTFSIIYFYSSKTKQNNIVLADGKGNNQSSKNPVNEKNAVLINPPVQQAIIDNNSFANAAATKKEELNTPGPGRNFFESRTTDKIKAISEVVAEDQTKIVNNKTFAEEVNKEPVVSAAENSTEKILITEKNIQQIIAPAKKDSSVAAQINQPLKKENKKQPGNNLKFSLTAFGGADYSAYRLVNDKLNSHDNKAGIATRERSDLSSSFGLLFGYKTGNKITIQSGIIYSSSNISISPTKIYAEKDNSGSVKFRYNTSSGYGYLLPSFSNSPAVGDSVFADGANHTLGYITFPVIVKYKLGNNKLIFNPGVGITFSFLTKATLTTDLVNQFSRETEVISKLEGIKKFSPGLVFTPEVQYQLSKNFSLSAIPYLKYSLGPINKGNVVKTYPYTVGLGLGVIYKF